MSVLQERLKVSIIVPLYNSEGYLRRCLDTLVNQSLPEKEIIAVNNGSTDGSLAILQQYEADFPEIMRVMTIPHSERAGAGRNAGMKVARGEYIMFVDSDDMMHPRAAEWMYNYASDGGYDLVYSPFYRVSNGRREVLRQRTYLQNTISAQQALLDAEPCPWGKIFSRGLLDKAGFFPEDCSFEDLAYFFAYVPRANNIGYFSTPFYFNFVRTDSETRDIAGPRLAETIIAERHGLERCGNECYEMVLYLVACRIRSNMAARWMFADRFLEHLQALWPAISANPRVQEDKKLLARLEMYYSMAEGQMPKIVYLDGFGRGDMHEETEKAEKTVFYDGCQVFVLNEDNCNVDERLVLREAYDQGNYEYVAGYFAMKNIAETGGVYIGRHIEVDIPVNFTRHLKAFFGYEGTYCYSAQFFGGKAGQEVFEKILEYYPEDDSPIMADERSLAQYIGCCLSVEYAIPCFARTNLYAMPVTVFSPEVISLPFMPEYFGRAIHFCHSTVTHTECGMDTIEVSKETLHWLAENAQKGLTVKKGGAKNTSAQRLEEITESRAWKAVCWLKARKDRPIGRLLHKVYLFAYYRVLKLS